MTDSGIKETVVEVRDKIWRHFSEKFGEPASYRPISVGLEFGCLNIKESMVSKTLSQNLKSRKRFGAAEIRRVQAQKIIISTSSRDVGTF